ncbi:MAG: prolipoprotein diacylglyceryl transferase [Patescibacteria group bacterium]
MLSFFHHFEPQALFFSLGWLNFYWYGLILVLGIISAIAISRCFWKKEKLPIAIFDDLSFWLIIGGLAGARIYEWFLNYRYYSTHLSELLKIWHGGLAIHGAILGAFFVLLFFSRKYHLKPRKIAATVIPGLAIGQAIGRWGNYFNQELFGLPSNVPWSIFISPQNRPFAYISFEYFHPTFLYESLACLLLFFLLLSLKRSHKNEDEIIIAVYLIGYALIRFFLEYLRIDQTPELFGLRWPQIASLFMFFIGGLLLYQNNYKKYHEKAN